VGQTLIILTAGIDLSVGAVAVLSMMVMAKVASEHGVPGFFALLIGIVMGLLAGLTNGLLVTRLKLPPFIVTLGTLSVFTAISLLYTKGRSVQAVDMPSLLNWTGTTIKLGPFNVTTGVLIVIALYLVIGFALTQTGWGRHVYSVGDDAEASRLAGIRINRVLLSVYVVAGLVYAIGAWVLIGRAGAASPNAIAQANLESITAVVIGGTSLFGGRGALIGSLLGALIVQSFTIGLSLAGVDDQWRLLAVGVLVIVAVSVDQWIRKVRA
jgi:fructose transport system permease protein